MEPAQTTSPDLSAILAKLAAQEAQIAALEAAQAQRRSRLPGRLVRAGLAAGLVALLLGTSASAAIPDTTTNVLTGCYRTAGSMNLLYVLNTPAQTTCPTGMSATTWPGTYRRIVVVSPVSGGSNTDNGTALLNALANITTASASTPYLLKLEPGIYDLGTSTLFMKTYVDIEGSGEGVTTITSNSPGDNGTVQGADTAELRWLTVRNTTSFNWAIVTHSLDSTARFTHVTAVGSGGFVLDGGAATLQAVTTPTSDGEGVRAVSGAVVSIQASTIGSSGNALFAFLSVLDVATSEVAGGVLNSLTIICVDDYNASFVALNTTCT